MASIIPGFSYDVYISYCRTDNKYDGWVSDFVANLKRELEAISKDAISVYFSENEAGAFIADDDDRGNLRSLLFIPIISHTYFDPKSNVLQQELLEFIKAASVDDLGLEIALPNGTRQSRILPVRIYEIDADDKHLLEQDLGANIRFIDFIYATAGVNRPLRAHEDDPSGNINRTFYRDQVNKVANNIREVIEGAAKGKEPPATNNPVIASTPTIISSARHLAAIMFTDIVGYTAMMQEDEAKATITVRNYYNALEKWVTYFRGRIVNYYGDGSLCIFTSATDAVQCSMELQQALRIAPVVPLRIGLHIGEVFFAEEKALGDGVNVASRIQSLGKENTILVSAEIHDKIKNNTAITAVSLGYFDFKNVHKPLEVFALANQGLAVPKRNSLEGKTQEKLLGYGIPRRIFSIAAGLFLFVSLLAYAFFYRYYSKDNDIDKSIAVIPFIDMSEHHDQEYFSDGMMEEILNHLSQIRDLRVISRTSSMKYKGSKLSIHEIANELDVGNILEGSVRTSGNMVRITAQLIDARTDKHLWSHDYDYRELKDIFAIQSDASTRVAEALKARLTSEEKGSLSKSYTDDPLAYKFYLKGRFLWDKRSRQNYDSAEIYFKRAIDLDPNYALAYSGLADLYTFNQKGLPQLEAIPIAKAYVEKALVLDSTLCEAWTTTGFIQSHFEYDWIGSMKVFDKAIQLNPNYPIAHLYKGNALFAIGQIEKGLQETRQALKLDPLSSTLNYVLIRNYYHARLYDLAIKQAEKTLALDPELIEAKMFLALSLLETKSFNRAIDLLNTFPDRQFANGANKLILLSYAYGVKGDVSSAKKEFAEAIAEYPKCSPYWIGMAYIAIGNHADAIRQFQRGYEMHAIQMIHLKINPALDVVRKDPGFVAILKELNLE